MTPSDTLKALCAAGDEATEGHWRIKTLSNEEGIYVTIEIERNEEIWSSKPSEEYHNIFANMVFAVQAANARPALKAYIERTERLEAELAMLAGAIGRAAGLLPEDTIIQNSYKALSGGEDE